MQATQQTTLTFRTWGGARKGAGRPRKPNAGISHLPRPALAHRFPVHVTVRMTRTTWNLRARRCFAPLARAFFAANDRFGMRLCHFAVLGNHIHFLVEARDARSLSQAMQGLGVRIAKALNRVMGKRGAVYADRYHARILRTPMEVARARTYVLHNARKHGFTRQWLDPCSSAATPELVTAPRTWLLGESWRR